MTNEIKIIEKIRAGYLPEEKETTSLDELKELDNMVKRPASIFAYVFGSVSSLVLGTGMCLAMKVIGSGIPFVMPLGIGVGLLGILGVSINYSIYKKILNSRKEKYRKQILELTDKLMNK